MNEYLKFWLILAAMMCAIVATVCVRDVMIEQIKCERTK